MKDKSNKKRITRVLPTSMKPIGELLADSHCKFMGLENGTPDYEDEFKKYIFNFNDEAYGLSMTPSGLIGQNPGTPKVQENYFNVISRIFGPEGFIEKLDTTDDKKQKFRGTLRGNIASLAHFILETRYGVKIKGKNGILSDFQFAPDATLSQREKTILNQYARLYYVIEIMKSVENLIDKENFQFEKVLIKIFGDNWKSKSAEFLNGNYTIEIMKALENLIIKDDLELESVLTRIFGDNWKNNTANFLNAKNNRVEFVNKLYLEGKNNSKELTRQNPARGDSKISKSEFYYAHEAGLYFDKEEVDQFFKANLKNAVQLEPKNSYVHFKTLTKEEITKSDIEIPIIIGSYFVKKEERFKIDYFLIQGEGQILKAITAGLPTIDAVIIDPVNTIAMIKKTKDTIDKIEQIKQALWNYEKQDNI